MRQTPRNTWPRVDEKLDLDLKKRLDDILARPLTPENINSYFDDRLNELIALVQQVKKTYSHIRPQRGRSDKEQEDRSFNQFELQEIPKIMDSIMHKKMEAEDVDAWIASNLTRIPKVIVPPEGSFERGEGGVMRESIMTDRTKTFLYLLKELGVDLHALPPAKQGIVPDRMMRRASYTSIRVPQLNRLALICDEEGNATYIFDAEKVSSIVEESELLSMDKQKLNRMLRDHPDTGVWLHYSENWTERVRELLIGKLRIKKKRKHERKQVELDTTTPRATQDAQDQWRGFHSDASGLHWAGPTVIADKFGIDSFIIKEALKENEEKKLRGEPFTEFLTKKMYDAGNRLKTGYQFEQMQEYFEDVLTTPKAESKGEWKGFAIVAGKHAAPVGTIAKKIGAAYNTTANRISKAKLNPMRMRNLSGHIDDNAYVFEDVLPLFKDFAETPRVAESGEWEDFYTDPATGKHVGTIWAIVRRERVLYASAKLRIEKAGFSARDIRVKGGPIHPGYVFEDVQPLITDLKKQG